MLLTLYYIAATYFQSWKFRNISNKIIEKIVEKSSVVFYNIPPDGNENTSATSELCTNRAQARISDFLWLRGNQRGCSLVPVQNLHLGPWVSFPEPPNLIPFEFGHNKNDDLILDNENLVHLLIETDTNPIVPENYYEDEDDVILIEEYGKPIAWKVDSHFAILLETDIRYFTKLIMSTFLQDRFIINDHLPLIRIEYVEFEGQPQPFDLIKNHLRKQLISRAMRHLSIADWEKHLQGLRSLSVLANQATEFEYNKNRTEGKTGIVKPDLIPSSSKALDESEKLVTLVGDNITTKLSPSKKLQPKIEAKVSPMRRSPEEKIKIITSPKKPPPPPSPSPIINSPQKSEIPKKVDVLIKKEIISNISPKPVEDKIDIKVEKKGSVSTKEISTETAIKPISDVDKTIPDVDKRSVKKDNAKRPSLKRNKISLNDAKPPNVLVYSNSVSMKDSIIASLKNVLETDTYTIYPLTSQQIQQKVWIDNTCLLVVCGSVDSVIGEDLLDYFLRGGKMLSLCSDVLNIVLPTYRTAEVREDELVQFSYDKWQKVKMMHHIFCYQPSPVKKHFSTESDESGPALSRKPALVCPRSVEMKDLQGDSHNLDVKVLGTEETWNTPSILLANNKKSGGTAVFSQVHLESDPSQFESDETKYSVLKQNDKVRLEILADLLKKHLDINVKSLTEVLNGGPKCIYKSAFFLGRHESKFELLEKLKSNSGPNDIIQTSKLAMKFCGKDIKPPNASTNLLPILIHSCPEDFSTVDYFDNLRSNEIGRLVIYTPIVSSSMHVITELTLIHGMAVISRQQTEGTGRHNNQWLSPDGCVMFSLQLHIPLDTTLGQRIPLLQQLIAVAVVNAILSIDGYENLDIRVKWPNDIYANGITKLGGLLINTILQHPNAICNIGCGINLNNSTPTICVNDLITDYNRINKKQLPLLRYEQFLALIFTEIERLINSFQSGDVKYLYDLYYKHWLHSNQEVQILDKNNTEKSAKIIGIDEYGYLKIQLKSGDIQSVQPDGNSFDMLRGLILPK